MKKFIGVLIGVVIVVAITTVIGYNLLMSGEKIIYIDDPIVVQNMKEEYFESYGYDLDNPYVIVNPYGNSPLTALVMFDSEEIDDINVMVYGKDGAVSYSYIVEGNRNNYIPVYGLYDDYENKVVIKMGDKEKEIKIKTESISEIEIINGCQDRDNTLVDMDSYSYMVDKNGDIRWYLEGYGGSLEILDNGHFLLHNGRSIGDNYYSGLVEIDMLGKIYYEYIVGDLGYRGDYTIIDNNIYIISYGYVNVISSQSGRIFRTYKIENDYDYIDNIDGDIICSNKDETIMLDIDSGKIEEIDGDYSYNNVYDMDNIKEVEYSIDRAIRIDGNKETDVSSERVWLFNYKDIKDKEFNIEMYQEFDRIAIEGYFGSAKEIYVILDGLSGKRVYQMEGDEDKYYKYISKIGLDGKYTIYFKIDGVLYKSNYYVKI